MNYKEHYKIDAESFDYFRKEKQTPDEIRRNETIFKLANITSGDKVLDIGSGNGWFSLKIAKNPKVKVTCLDLTLKNLNRIKEENKNITIKFGDAMELPFDEEEKFDWIVANEVLEHLPNPIEAISEWSKFLKKDGKLLISVPYMEKIKKSLCIHCNKLTPHNAHLHSFGISSIGKIFNREDFFLEKRKVYQSKVFLITGCNRFLKFLPYGLWSFFDSILNIIFKKPAYLSFILKRR